MRRTEFQGPKTDASAVTLDIGTLPKAGDFPDQPLISVGLLPYAYAYPVASLLAELFKRVWIAVKKLETGPTDLVERLEKLEKAELLRKNAQPAGADPYDATLHGIERIIRAAKD